MGTTAKTSPAIGMPILDALLDNIPLDDDMWAGWYRTEHRVTVETDVSGLAQVDGIDWCGYSADYDAIYYMSTGRLVPTTDQRHDDALTAARRAWWGRLCNDEPTVAEITAAEADGEAAAAEDGPAAYDLDAPSGEYSRQKTVLANYARLADPNKVEVTTDYVYSPKRDRLYLVGGLGFEEADNQPLLGMGRRIWWEEEGLPIRQVIFNTTGVDPCEAPEPEPAIVEIVEAIAPILETTEEPAPILERQSAFSTFMSCPLKWWFDYRSGLDKHSSLPLAVGCGVHKALHKRNLGEDDPKVLHATLQEEFDLRCVEGLGLSVDDEIKRIDQANTAHTTLDTYLNCSPPRLTDPERLIHAPIPGHEAHHWKGEVDGWDGETMVDYKTAAKKWNRGREEFELQPPMYSLIRVLLGEIPEDYEHPFRFVILLKTRKGLGGIDIRSTTVTPAKRERCKRILMRVWENMVAENIFPAFGMQCSWCQFSRQCQEWEG